MHVRKNWHLLRVNTYRFVSILVFLCSLKLNRCGQGMFCGFVACSKRLVNARGLCSFRKQNTSSCNHTCTEQFRNLLELKRPTFYSVKLYESWATCRLCCGMSLVAAKTSSALGKLDPLLTNLSFNLRIRSSHCHFDNTGHRTNTAFNQI